MEKRTADEIRECIKMGVTSFKVYMAYKKTIGLDDKDLLKVMRTVGAPAALSPCTARREMQLKHSGTGTIKTIIQVPFIMPCRGRHTWKQQP